VHPKLSAVNLSVKPLSEMSDEELDQVIEEAAALDTMTGIVTDGPSGLVH
jgi:hypothetical protein